MKIAHGGRALAAFFLTAGLAACFTEVGNPAEEPAMSARVHVDPSGAPETQVDSVRIVRMELRLLAAAWRNADSTEAALWPAQAGRLLDFAAGDTLPRARLAASPIGMSVRLGTPPGLAVITGVYSRGGALLNFRFSLPDTLDFSLGYGREALEAWRTGSEYACVLAFLPQAWLDLPGLDTATALAGEPADSVIFDSQNNPELHRALSARLGLSFNGSRHYPKSARTMRPDLPP